MIEFKNNTKLIKNHITEELLFFNLLLEDIPVT